MDLIYGGIGRAPDVDVAVVVADVDVAAAAGEFAYDLDRSVEGFLSNYTDCVEEMMPTLEYCQTLLLS